LHRRRQAPARDHRGHRRWFRRGSRGVKTLTPHGLHGWVVFSSQWSMGGNRRVRLGQAFFWVEWLDGNGTTGRRWSLLASRADFGESVLFFFRLFRWQPHVSLYSSCRFPQTCLVLV
jgi:hypothetical protein